MNYWLFKSEPDLYSIDDLADAKQQTSIWDGVRNYQARNFLRDQCQLGDSVLFYHSSCQTPGIAGLAWIVRAGYPDPSAFIKESPYYDSASQPGQPRWYCVDVQLVRKLPRLLSLAQLRNNPDLADMHLLRRGNRLSITPVTQQEWQAVLAMEYL